MDFMLFKMSGLYGIESLLRLNFKEMNFYKYLDFFLNSAYVVYF